MLFLRYASRQTDRQPERHTDMLIAILCTHTVGQRIKIIIYYTVYNQDVPYTCTAYPI